MSVELYSGRTRSNIQHNNLPHATFIAKEAWPGESDSLVLLDFEDEWHYHVANGNLNLFSFEAEGKLQKVE